MDDSIQKARDTVAIEAPINAVFSTFVNVERWTDVISSVEKTEILRSDGIDRIEFAEIRKKPSGKRELFMLWLTNVNEPHSFEITSCAFGFKLINQFLLLGRGDATKVVFECSCRPMNRFAELAESFYGKSLLKTNNRIVSDDVYEIKNYLESDNRI